MTTTTPTTPNRRAIPGWAGPLIVIVILIFVLGGCAVKTKNSMVTMDENVNNKWNQVQVDYQRRADLIPSLVNTVQGYTDFEKSTLVEITEMRSRVGKAQQTINDPNAPVDEKVAAVNTMETSLSRLLIVVENYPDLKAGALYQDLMSQLEGTENRISNSRRKFNDAIQEYNTYIRKFPQSIFAGFFGFQKRDGFAATPGSENAPDVKFDNK